ncbi:DUF86 domain-containing protein [Candidatus Uhrbacteria bacterium]|nr:DUF86 domain-containing protein [Candidatus Uhrbacteria bacterium]
MVNPRDELYILHILDTTEQITAYVGMLEWETFMNDRKTHDACIRQIEIIGEASKRLSSTCTNAINLPWKEIAGTRDFLIHNYAEVDLESLWKTIKVDIPELKERLEAYLKARNTKHAPKMECVLCYPQRMARETRVLC